jgi:hypothetical protein
VRTLEKRIRSELQLHLERAGLGSDLAAFAHETSGATQRPNTPRSP